MLKKNEMMGYRYIVVLILFFIWIAVYVQRVNVGILIVDANFLEDMNLVGQTARQGLLMTLFLLMYSLTNIFAAPLSDSIGPRKTMFLGLFIAALSMVIGGLAGLFSIVLFSRILLGMGQGIYYPTQSTLVKKWFPPQERGKANAVYGIGCIGPLIAIPVFTYLITIYGWRSLFVIGAVLGFLCLIPIITGHITDDPFCNRFVSEQEKEYISGELNPAGEKSHQRLNIKELKPIVSSKEFWLIVVSYSAYLSVWWGIVTWVPQYLNVARGFSLASLGWVAAIPYGSAALGVTIGGWVSDHMDQRAGFGIIALLGASVCILFAAVIPSNSWAAFLIVFAPVFNQLYYAPVWSILQELVPESLIGTSSGLMNGGCNLVAAAAPWIIGFLIELTDSYAAGLMYLAVFGVVGAFSCYLLLKHETNFVEK